MIRHAGLSLELIDSWKLNPLELDKERCHTACIYFLGPQNHGAHFEPTIMQTFLKGVESAYQNVPYHAWFHAVDVAHCVYRLSKLLKTDSYFSKIEQYGLLVSAIAHD